MATAAMIIPDVEEEVKQSILSLAKQLNISVAKLLRLLIDVYQKQQTQPSEAAKASTTRVQADGTESHLVEVESEYIKMDPDVDVKTEKCDPQFEQQPHYGETVDKISNLVEISGSGLNSSVEMIEIKPEPQLEVQSSVVTSDITTSSVVTSDITTSSVVMTSDITTSSVMTSDITTNSATVETQDCESADTEMTTQVESTDSDATSSVNKEIETSQNRRSKRCLNTASGTEAMKHRKVDNTNPDDEISGESIDEEDSEEDFDGFEILSDEDDELFSAIDKGWEVGAPASKPTMVKFEPNLTGLRSQDLPANPTYLDYYKLFVPDHVFTIITRETNRYAEEYLEKNKANLKPSSRRLKWKPATEDEIKGFVSLMLSMSMIHQQDLNEYWSADQVTSTPFFPSVMSRDRFSLLLTFLNFSDSSGFIPRGEDGYDPFYKLGTIYHDIINLFATNYYPTKNIAIGEGIVPWRDSKVSNPYKTDKFGMRIYQLRDETGYCCKYELSTGRPSDVSKHGATYDLCMRMMERYLNRGHCLYVDKFYTSPVLISHLYQQGTGACGTLRITRKHVPNIIKFEKPAKGEILAVNKGPLMIMKYQDRHQPEMVMCSTLHRGVMVDSGKANSESNQAIKKPDAVLDYNEQMRSLDRSDHLVGYLGMKRRTITWYKKVIFHLLDLCAVQAYIIYKMKTEKPVPHRTFRKELVKQMVASLQMPDYYKVDRFRSQPPPTALQPFLRIQSQFNIHYLVKREGTAKRKCNTTGCAVCSASEKKLLQLQGMAVPGRRVGRESSFECAGCSVALCLIPCFQMYHTEVDIFGAYFKWKGEH